MWFKRDLRTVDHRPLLEACAHGPVLPLSLNLSIGGNRMFCPPVGVLSGIVGASWRELAALGQPLVVRCGEAVTVLERARQSRYRRHLEP